MHWDATVTFMQVELPFLLIFFPLMIDQPFNHVGASYIFANIFSSECSISFL